MNIHKDMQLEMNDVMKVTERLYYEANSNTRMDVPSYAYEKVEKLRNEWLYLSDTTTLYEYCKSKVDKK